MVVGNETKGFSMDTWLNVAELAQVLGITSKAVYCRLYEGRQSVPTSLHIPGSSHLRWRQSDAEAWLAALPARVTGKPQPRRYKDKVPVLTRRHCRPKDNHAVYCPRGYPNVGLSAGNAGEAAAWEK